MASPFALFFPLTPTPLALRVIFAHLFANERLNMFGALGCILAVAGSMTMTLSVPEERSFNSVLEVWQLAIQPGEGEGLEVPAREGELVEAAEGC